MASKRALVVGPLSEARRAEASAIPRSDVARRVDLIAELMSTLEYVPGETDRELAALWGLEASSLRHQTAEASRRIRACFTVENADLLRAQLLRRMLEIGEAAAARTKEVVDSEGNVHSVRDPDMRTALQAVVEVGTFMGLRTERHEHSFDLGKLSDAELKAQLGESLIDNPELLLQLREAGWAISPPPPPERATDDEPVH
jgi:hypothetical protein